MSPKEGGSTNIKSKKSKASPAYDTGEVGNDGSRNDGRVPPPVDLDPLRNELPESNASHHDSGSGSAPEGSGSVLEHDLEHMDESLLNVVNSGWQGLDLAKLIANNYSEDSFFKHILETPKAFRNFEIEDGLIYLKDSDHRVLCVPKITYRGRNIREIVISEAHSILAHLGVRKTLDYLRDHFWWKEVVEDTRSFCESCATCKRSKPSNQKPYGLLHSLNPPLEPWDSVGVDFVGPLPESRNCDGVFNSIAVIIDLLTGMTHIVPARINYTARQMAELMFENIYKLHGLPKSIVSDRDSLFTSIFWKRLHELIGVKSTCLVHTILNLTEELSAPIAR
jgi:hypothetical protein